MLKKWPVQPVSAIFMNGEGPSGAIEFTVSLLSRLMLGGPLSAYLRDVLDRLPTTPVQNLPDLLPDTWFVANPRARRKNAA